MSWRHQKPGWPKAYEPVYYRQKILAMAKIVQKNLRPDVPLVEDRKSRTVLDTFRLGQKIKIDVSSS